ncbi:MAG: toll/interleukin-1 receptor domain-containing protein [gamma proteobacterium endosymbiont of Lamellibrachia anaximandri]|nr:toll/interleukin-1 receptor domain-containing protein [gamma proteobacterium endosymbiont of Lamellibrachia anaximandri]
MIDTTKADVFISYPESQKAQAKELKKHLENEGVTAFVAGDGSDFQIGNWREKINEAQEHAKLTVALVHEDTSNREHQLTEIERAHKLKSDNPKKHELLPCAFDIDLSSMPSPLPAYNAFPVGKGNPSLIEIAKKIAEQINTKTEKPNPNIQSGCLLTLRIVDYERKSPKDKLFAKKFISNQLDKFSAIFTGKEPQAEVRGGIYSILITPTSTRNTYENLLESSLESALAAAILFQHNGNKLKNSEKVLLTIVIGVVTEVHNHAAKINTYNYHYLTAEELDKAYLLASFFNEPRILLSETAYESLQHSDYLHGQLSAVNNYIKTSGNPVDSDVFLQNYTYKGREIQHFYDQYGIRHSVHNCYWLDSSKKIIFGDSRPLRQLLHIDYRDTGKLKREHPFIVSLVESDEVDLIGLTNEHLIDFLQQAYKYRENKFWKRLSITFASNALLENILDQHNTSEKYSSHNSAIMCRKQSSEIGWRSIYQFLLGCGEVHRDKWECYKYDHNLPFVGQRLLINNNNGIENKTTFRISPLLPGRDTSSNFYMNIPSGTQACDMLEDSYSKIKDHRSPLIEWTIYGSISQNKSFIPLGVENRKNSHTLPTNFCVPIVIILGFIQITAIEKQFFK